jgi:hypothetical protein
LKIIPLATGVANWPFYLFQSQMLLSGDFFWLLDQLGNPANREMQAALIELIKQTFSASDSGYADALRAAAEKNAALATEFIWFLNPGSPEAEAVRKQVAQWEALIPTPQARVLLDPPPDLRVVTLFARFESGDLEAFSRLNAELTLEPDSTHYGDLREPSIKLLPGWKCASDETRHRIVAAAHDYLNEYVPPDAEGWLKTDSIPYACLAGYRALLLLMTEAPDLFGILSTDAWSKWA